MSDEAPQLDLLSEEELVAIEACWGLDDRRERTCSQLDVDLSRLVADVRRLKAERERLVREVARWKLDCEAEASP